MQETKLKIDLKERSYKFALEVIKFLDALNQKDLIVREISRQLLRSANSIGANIMEAMAASSRKDFANFYYYALKSANETKFWLSLLKDSNKAEVGKVSILLTEAQELANILAASVISLKKE